jgi:hypothetical protein
MPKKTEPKLEKNMLVPFLGTTAEEIRAIAQLNGLAATVVIRMVVDKGLQAIREGKTLALRLPGDGQ